mmetsp:Transcript_20332/g.33659  ORF Transcript_20332/g.33659 Transcript_20332/m.33659 type:complete len:333 (+) Transcript_20332:25-1023(+)
MVSVSTVILEYVCPTLGAIVANVMFSAPYNAVKNAVARGHLGDLNPTPWAFMMGNTIGWITYSILLHNYFIFFANTPGFLLSVWFNLCAVKLQYQSHCATEMRQSFVGFLESNNNKNTITAKQRKKLEQISLHTIDQETDMEREQPQQHKEEEEADTNTWQTATDLGSLVLQVTTQQTPAPAPHEKVVLGMIFIWTVILCLIALADFESRTRELIIGICVNINLFFFYGAPLSTIFTVLKERNSASIHIWTMATNTANGSFWTAYGIAVLDPFIYIPNGLGAMLGVVQIILSVLFPRKHHIQDGADPNISSTMMVAAEEPTPERTDEGKEAW